ncbi:hypothetical protein D1007_13926 [Hordeum vulgare]|nr:hypothetical protein D1007_13926 [Hordeum vulgare]
MASNLPPPAMEEYTVYHLEEMVRAHGEIISNYNPAAGQSSIRIHGVESLKAAREMLRLAEHVEEDYGAKVDNINTLRLLGRVDKLICDVALHVFPCLGVNPDPAVVLAVDRYDSNGCMRRHTAYVEAVELLSAGANTEGIFPGYVHTFTAAATATIHQFAAEDLAGAAMMQQLKRALNNYSFSGRTAYIPLP